MKLFHDFTNGLHPLLVKPADIEVLYDQRLQRVDRQTTYLDIQALKYFFKGVEHVVPFFVSPFKKMPDKLLRKLNRTRHTGTKKALNRQEIRRIFECLQKDKTEKGLEDYAIFKFLYTTGLRGSELCSICWGDIEWDEEAGSFYVNGIGKGEKPFRQEIVDPIAVEAAERYFRKTYHRKPRTEDHIFWTVPRFNGDTRRPLLYPTLYHRILGIGKAVRSAGVINRDIDFSPHLLRRSIITNLRKAGMRVKALQNFSRHNSVNTLLKHYVDDEETAKKYYSI